MTFFASFRRLLGLTLLLLAPVVALGSSWGAPGTVSVNADNSITFNGDSLHITHNTSFWWLSGGDVNSKSSWTYITTTGSGANPGSPYTVTFTFHPTNTGNYKIRATYGTTYDDGLQQGDPSRSYIGEVDIIVSAPDTSAPTQPGAINASYVSTSSFSASWGASTDSGGSGLKWYAVELRAGSANGSAISSFNTTTTSATFSGLSQGSTYGVAVWAVDNAGNVSPVRTTEYRILDLTPPSQPGTPSFSAITASGFTAAWSASTDTGGSGMNGYEVYVMTGSVNGPLAVGIIYANSPSCVVTGLLSNTTYYVKILARDGDNNHSSPSSNSVATLEAIPPSDPGALTFSDVFGNSALASWGASTDTGGSGLAGYEVVLKQGGTVISTNTTEYTTYPFSTLTAGLTYTVSVRAYDNAGNYSNPRTGTFVAGSGGVQVGDARIWGAIAADTDPGTPSAITGVGVLSGGLSVDNRGQANFSIPLKLPPGRSGLEPKLSLDYSSGSGDGPLGLGWALSTGFPRAITRGRTIQARDGVVKGITFSAADKFYLDGKRLILVSTDKPYGEPGSAYRTEVDSFVTVATAGNSGVIETFTVTDKAGTKMIFGRNGSDWDGFQKGGMTPADSLAYAYALKRVEDAAGNYLDFKYREVTTTSLVPLGEFVLSEIRYTGNTGQAGLDRGKISFRYNFVQTGGTTERNDRSLTYIAGRLFAHSRRLDGIDVEFGGERAAYYALDYQYTPNAGPLRLAGVRPYLRNPGDSGFMAVPATTFEWSASAPTFSSLSANLASVGNVAAISGQGTGQTAESYGFADADGDGRDDFIDGRTTNGLAVSLSTGTGFAAPVTWGTGLWTGPRPVMKFADINGDGKKDIIYGSPLVAGTNQLFALVSTGSGFATFNGGSAIFTFTDEFKDPPPQFSGSNLLNFQQHEEYGVTNRIATGDFNGDGCDDILIHRYDGRLKVLKSTGTAFAVAGEYDVGARALSGMDAFDNAHSVWSGLNYLGFRVTDTFSVSMMPCELNGDGITDYAWVESDNNWGISSVSGGPTLTFYSGARTAYAVTSLPGGGFSPRHPIGAISWNAVSGGGDSLRHRANSFMILPGDVNGDGLTDFIRMVPGNVVPATNDEGASYPTSQCVLHHDLLLSMGTSSGGEPAFEVIGGPFPIAVSDNPYVTINGQAVRPWYDSISIGEFYNSGYGSLSPSPSLLMASGVTSDNGSMTLADLNGDGRQDYVWYNDKGANAGWLVMYSRGSIFSAPVPAPVNWSAPEKLGPGTNLQMHSRRSLELNGDGVPDYAYSVQQHTDAPGVSGIYVSQGKPGPRLAAVVDGLHKRTDISYLPITDSTIYTPGPAVLSYPIRELRNASYVVSDVLQDSGVDGSPAHFTYQYAGNRLDLSGRGSLGFHSFVTLDRQTNFFKYQFLAQSFPMTGLTHREETYRWLGGNNFNLISSHDNTVVFDKVSTAGGATLWPFISRAVEYRWEDGAGALPPVAASIDSNPENLFGQAKPYSTAHIHITAESRFDNAALQTTLPGVSGYNPSDVNGSGQNTVSGTASFTTTFSGSSLPGAVTYGNLTELKTDFDDGYGEKVVTHYYSPTANGITGLVQDAQTFAWGGGHGTESSPEAAPKKTYLYWTGANSTSLVDTESVDATAAIPAGPASLNLSTKYNRDSLGRVTSTVLTGHNNPGPEGSAVLGSFTEANIRHIGSYTVSSLSAYDSNFDVPTQSANSYGHGVTTDYHPRLGLPTRVVDVNSSRVDTTYDAMGRTLVTTDVPKNLSTTNVFALDTTQTVSGPGGHTGFAAAATGAAPLYAVTAVSLTSAYKVTTNTTVKSQLTTYYDRLGRAIRTIKEGFNGQQVVTDIAYNNLGQMIATSLPYVAGNTPLWTKTTYDVFGRVASVRAPNGTVTTSTYIGRATKVGVNADNWGGADPLEQVNSTVVDAKGRTVKVWNADNVPPSFSDNKGTTSTSPSIAFDLDGFGRMRTTTLKDQAAPISATYDAYGRQETLSDPDKGSWTYVNNALGQVVRQEDANHAVTRSTYDQLGRPLGRKTWETSGPQETASWYYYDTDAAKPQTVARGADGWVGALQRDESATAGTGIGYATANSATKNVHYYDGLGRPAKDVTLIDGKFFYTQNSYDAYSRPQSVRYYWKPAGAEDPGTQPYLWQDFGYTYTYDTRSYLLSLRDNLGRTWWQADATLGYDYLDRATKVTKGSGYTTTRTYRAEDGALTGIATTGGIQALSFDYDGLVNLTSRSGNGQSEALAYDNLNRLANSSKQGAIAYAPNGNITSKSYLTGTGSGTVAISAYWDARPHAVKTYVIGPDTFSLDYDANGNLTSRSGGGQNWSLKYAGFDKPRWMTKTAGGVTVGSEFLYNANRSRIMQLEYDAVDGNGAPSHYVRKRTYGLGPVLELNYDFTTATPNPWALKKVRVYVQGPDGVIGSREFDPGAALGTGTEKAYVYHYDHLGSIESITPFGSTNGTLAKDGGANDGRFSEDAWGQRRDPSDWQGGVPAGYDDGKADSLTPRGFTGHEMLDDLGLVHMNGRIYDPLLGRMLSADLVVQSPGDLQSYNRYSYVRNNPLTKIDPSGWFDVTLFGFRFSNEGDYSGKRIASAIKSGNWKEVKAVLKSTTSDRTQEGKNFGQKLANDAVTKGAFGLMEDLGGGPKFPVASGPAAPGLATANGAVIAGEAVTVEATAISGTISLASKMAGGDIKAGDGSTVSEKPPLKEGETGTYGELQSRSKKGDGLDIHESPSNKAQEKAFVEKYRKENGGADPSPKEIAANREQNASVAIKRDTHVETDTFGGNNTDAKSTADAANLDAAAQRGADSLNAAGQKTGVDLSKAAEELLELQKKRNGG